MDLALYLGYRALRANRRTTLILAVSVTMTVAVVLVMSSLLFGFRGEFIGKTVNSTSHVRITAEELDRALQPAKLSEYGLLGVAQIDHVKPSSQPNKIRNSKGVVSELKETAGVLHVSPTLTTNVLIKNGSVVYPASVYGMIPEEENAMTDLFSKTVQGNMENLKSQDKGIAIGNIIGTKLGLETGNLVKLVARDGTSYEFKVVAILQTGVTSQDDSRIWMLLKDAQTLAKQYNEITDIGVKILDYEQAQEYADRFASTFGYQTESWQVANANILSLLIIIFANIYFVLGGLILAAAFGIYNVFSMSVIDRRREIAIMQGMGLTGRTISWSFFLQGVVIGLIGGALGVIVGHLLIEVFSNITFAQSDNRLTDAKGFVMLKAWWLYVGSYLLGIILAVLSAILPSRRAGMISPVAVIREG